MGECTDHRPGNQTTVEVEFFIETTLFKSEHCLNQ